MDIAALEEGAALVMALRQRKGGTQLLVNTPARHDHSSVQADETQAKLRLKGGGISLCWMRTE